MNEKNEHTKKKEKKKLNDWPIKRVLIADPVSLGWIIDDRSPITEKKSVLHARIFNLGKYKCV